MKKLISLLLLFASINVSFGNPDELELDLQIKATLYQSSIQTQLYLNSKLTPIIHNSIIDTQDLNKERLSKKIDDVLKDIVSNPLERSTIKGMVVNALKNVRTIARKEGIAIATQIALNQIVGFLGPVAVVAIGVPQLILPVQLLTTTSINVPLHLAIKNLFKRKAFLKAYGGKKNWKRIKQLRKEISRDYGLDDKSAIFNVSEDAYFSISKNFSFLNKMLAMFKDSKKINPASLKRVLKRSNLWNPDLLKIYKTKLGPALKSTLLMAYVIKNNSNGLEVLMESFPGIYYEIKETEYNPELFNWAHNFNDVNDVDELFNWVDQVPEGTSAFEVLLLWKNVFLPYLLKNSISGARYKTYRYWSEQFQLIFAQAELNPTAPWDEKWIRDFKSYVSADR